MNQDRLKAAKTDASSEIAAYKQKKEQELKQYEAEEAETQVKEELEKIQKTASEKQAEVVKLLINAVTKPTPELHINASS
ncbi:unnamed protein product [Wickerhamomyces anomalus]